jgi:hypothetical protein
VDEDFNSTEDRTVKHNWSCTSLVNRVERLGNGIGVARRGSIADGFDERIATVFMSDAAELQS